MLHIHRERDCMRNVIYRGREGVGEPCGISLYRYIESERARERERERELEREEIKINSKTGQACLQLCIFRSHKQNPLTIAGKGYIYSILKNSYLYSKNKL